jgi:hypothetical protein
MLQQGRDISNFARRQQKRLKANRESLRKFPKGGNLWTSKHLKLGKFRHAKKYNFGASCFLILRG